MTELDKNLVPQLVPSKTCKKDLCFISKAVWPVQLPSVAVNGFLISGFENHWAFNYQTDSMTSKILSDVFKSFHPFLGYLELAQLCVPWNKTFGFPFAELAQAYGFKWTQNDDNMSVYFSEFSVTEKQWLIEKGISKSELSLLWEMGSTAKQILAFAMEHKISKSEFVCGAEICCHLKTDKALPHNGDTYQSWIKRISLLRYPVTMNMDKYFMDKIKSLPWQKNTTAKWSRSGDKSGLEIKFFVSQPSELKNQINSLTKIQEILEADNEWNISKH
jgi:hypothetical protein